MKSDTKTRNTKKTIVRMLAAMLIGGVIGGVSTVVYEIVFGEDFSGRSLSLLTEVTRRLMVPGLLSVLVFSIAAYEICFKKLRNVCDRIEDAEDEEFHRLDYEEERYGAILQCINVVTQVLCIALLGSGYSMRYIHDETVGKFKMWYSAGGEKTYGLITCYAESTDGKTWHKPMLDVVPGTNIVDTLEHDCVSVLLDKEEKDPQKEIRRLKAR